MQTPSHRRLQLLQRRQRIQPNALCSKRTVDHASPETNEDARANLNLASWIERAPRLLSARKESTTSIARPLMRRREETVHATDRMRDIRLLAPLQDVLAGETS